MLRTPIAESLVLLRWVAITASLLSWWSCTNPEGPTTFLGTYNLTACNVGASETAVPCVYENGIPGDSERVYGSVLGLEQGSTWTNVWQRAHCSGGVCGEVHADTVHGTFARAPGDGPDLILVMRTWPYVDCCGSAVIRGHRLELYALWTYERQD